VSGKLQSLFVGSTGFATFTDPQGVTAFLFLFGEKAASNTDYYIPLLWEISVSETSPGFWEPYRSITVGEMGSLIAIQDGSGAADYVKVQGSTHARAVLAVE
jgi:hypothetical protein